MDRKRPGGLLAVAVLAIILGALGTCGGLTSIGSQLVQSQMQDFSRQMAEVSSQGNEQILEQQITMQERVEALTAEWRPAILAHQVLNLIASLALLAAAIQMLRWKPSALTMFVAAAIASIAVDLGGGVVQILFQRETSAIMTEYMSGLSAATPGVTPDVDRTMGAAMSASATVGMVVGVAWVVMKLGFYSAGLVYVRGGDVRALFAPRS